MFVNSKQKLQFFTTSDGHNCGKLIEEKQNSRSKNPTDLCWAYMVKMNWVINWWFYRWLSSNWKNAIGANENKGCLPGQMGCDWKHFAWVERDRLPKLSRAIVDRWGFWVGYSVEWNERTISYGWLDVNRFWKEREELCWKEGKVRLVVDCIYLFIKGD